MTKWPPGLLRIWRNQGLALMMEKTTSSRELQARPGRTQTAFIGEEHWICWLLGFAAAEQMCCAWHKARM